MPAYRYSPHIYDAITESLKEVQARGVNMDRAYQAVLSSRSETEAHRAITSLGLTPSDKLGEAFANAHKYEREYNAAFLEIARKKRTGIFGLEATERSNPKAYERKRT